MTNIETMKLAIDAAQNDDPSRVISLLHQAILIEQRKDVAMKLALSSLEDIGDEFGFTSKRTVPRRLIAIAALRKAISEAEQAEQGPVAWADKLGAVRPHSHKLFQPELLKEYTIPLYTAPPQAEQEPVSGVVIREGLPTLLNNKYIKDSDKRLYTAPPQREWMSLTDDEIEQAVLSVNTVMEAWITYRAIEAKLKEKNT